MAAVLMNWLLTNQVNWLVDMKPISLDQQLAEGRGDKGSMSSKRHLVVDGSDGRHTKRDCPTTHNCTPRREKKRLRLLALMERQQDGRVACANYSSDTTNVCITQ